MKYPDGQSVQLGDRVKLGDDDGGVVVCSIDTDEFTDLYPRGDWDYLAAGVLIEFPKWGLIHYVEPEDDLVLLRRSCK